MPLSSLLAGAALPVEAVPALLLAALLALLAEAEPAPPEEATTAALFAFHGHV